MFIKEFSEQDIGLPESTGINRATIPTRIVVRGIVFNNENKISLIHHPVMGGYSLPGGAVDGQLLEIAFKREMQEEIGTDVTDLLPLGITREYKVYDTIPVINQTIYFSAKTVGEGHEIELTEEEIAAGHEPMWVSVEEAKTLIRTALLESPGYWATFELQRDLYILEQYSALPPQSSKLKDAEEIAKKAQYDYIMLKSEFDSFTRRVESDTKESKANQLVELAKKLLPIVDQLGQSVSHIPADLESNTWAAGVTLTYENAIKSLSGLGISQIPTIGLEPDMELHDPLSVEPTDDEERKGKIITEFQPGYIYEKDGIRKVITAAKVIVGQ